MSRLFSYYRLLNTEYMIFDGFFVVGHYGSWFRVKM